MGITFACSICDKQIAPEEVVITWRGYTAHSACNHYEMKADAMEMDSIRWAEARNEMALYGPPGFVIG